MSSTTIPRKSRDLYQTITDAIVKELEAGAVPWQRPWRAEVGPARNAFSGRRYSGINAILLGLAPYDDPRWATYRQIREHRGHVRRGEHGSRVCFFKYVDTEEESSAGNDEPAALDGRGRYAVLRSYVVFNVTQADGLDLPPLPQPPENPVEPSAAAEVVLAEYPKPPRVVSGGNAATYNPAADVVGIPALGAFESVEAYYLTLWHELIHSTGHPSRLNRVELIAGRFGDARYAREELTAEIGSAMIAARVGVVAPDIEQSAAYIAGWLAALRDDKKLIVVAAGRAQKAADWILGALDDEKPALAAIKTLQTTAVQEV